MYGNFFLASVRRTKRILRDPDREIFFVRCKEDRSNDSESGKTFHNLTFSITMCSFVPQYYHSTRCHVGMYGMREPSEIEIVVVYFARLRHDAIILMKGVLWPRDT